MYQGCKSNSIRMEPMEKQEIRITTGQWPVIISNSENGEVKAECPFFSDCKSEGANEEKVLQEVEFKIRKKLSDTKWIS